MTFGLCGSFNGGRFRSLFHQVAQAELCWPNKGRRAEPDINALHGLSTSAWCARSKPGPLIGWARLLYLQLCSFFFFFTPVFRQSHQSGSVRFFSSLMGFRLRNASTVCASRRDYNLRPGNFYSEQQTFLLSLCCSSLHNHSTRDGCCG